MICITGLPVFYQLLFLFYFRIFHYSCILLILTCFLAFFFDVTDADAKREGNFVCMAVFVSLRQRYLLHLYYSMTFASYSVAYFNAIFCKYIFHLGWSEGEKREVSLKKKLHLSILSIVIRYLNFLSHMPRLLSKSSNFTSLIFLLGAKS
jgi:hypothetical protein